MEQDFIVDQASWHTQKVRNYDFDKSIVYEYFRNIFYYLQNNNLTTSELFNKNQDVNDEACLRKSDLTEEGFAFIKLVYDKWIDKIVDKKILPADYRSLDRALKKVRSK